MALLHHAELTPSKIEIIESWAPSQPWYQGAAGVGLSSVAAYRFDDPDGQVGVETVLVRAADGPIMQVPLTYRDAPLAGAEHSLIGTLEHSVLGTRWIYDGVGDPVYLQAVASAVVNQGTEAQMYFEEHGKKEVREPTARVAGSGISGAAAPAAPSVAEISVRFEQGVTIVDAGSLTIVVARVPGDGMVQAGAEGSHGILTGTWSGQSEPLPLVTVFVR